ncbi:uncharacterized protein LOC116205290 [Punica granatum]|uniref:Uncharacterized protein LOC116205290 n=1 Tax=Punica granatum TaxID=22663 RepID=A0A218WKZ8_PUNGR|nr:uncharacterized protein LOC116205290 [Punica granatum]OWM73050.1 hypothetical protein CDL15_Pgr001164 [Punica granatum]
MSSESRKSNPGAPTSKSSSDNRKSSATGPVGRRIIIKSADMKDDMQKEAVDIAVAAFEKHGAEKDVAKQPTESRDTTFFLGFGSGDFGFQLKIQNPSTDRFKWVCLKIDRFFRFTGFLMHFQFLK